MAAVLRRAPVRLGVLLTILCALIAVTVVRGTRSSTSADDGSQPTPSPAQVQLVTAWLERVQLPAVVRRDVTQTPCHATVVLCVTAPETPSELIVSVRSALKASGASMGKTQCVNNSQMLLSGFPGCAVGAVYHGVHVQLASGSRSEYPQPNSYAMAVLPGPYVSPKSVPLPPPGALKSIGAIPEHWRVAMRCVISMPGGCSRYLGHLTLRGSACAEIADLVRTLVRSDYNIGLRSMRSMPFGTRCGVGADRRLKPGGGGWFILGAILTDEPNHQSTGQLYLSAM